jgi:hypothetical protein
MIVRPPPIHRPGAVIADGFINSKRDKLTIKRSAFLNRIEKAHKKPLKRRRPNKKLKTTLEGLSDALPDVEDLVRDKNNADSGKIKMKSLKSKPGAMKRKEKLERTERERFGKNMAQIMAVKEEAPTATADGSTTASAAPVTTSRFAALRAWATANMEKHPGFENATE